MEDESKSEATDEIEMSPDDQITDLLKGEEEVEEEVDAPQEDEAEEADQPEPDESKQEDAEEEEPTWSGALGLDDSQIVLDDEGNFKGVMTTIEGETKPVDLKELVKGYQIDSYNTQRSQAMAQERKQFEEYAAQQAQTFQSQLQQATGLVETLEKQLVGEYDSINWEQLRQADPAEYAARRQDYAVKYQQVQQVANSITQEQQQLNEKAQQQQQQATFAHLQEEAQKALKIKPEWTDPTVRNQAIQNMGEFLANEYGYTQDEIIGITDHRIIRMIDDAQAYKSIKTKAKPKLEKPVPKFQKPGSGAKKADKKSRLNKLYKSAAASKDNRVKDDAITQLLLNS